MAFVTHRTGLARHVRPSIAARTVPPIRSRFGWALPLVLMIAALMVPVIASLSLRALVFLPN